MPNVDALLAALGVRATALPVAAYSNGHEHVLVALGSAREVSELTPDPSALAAAARATVSVFHFDGQRVTSRVFAPYAGVLEDPATGSAAAPVALHLHASGLLGGRQELTIDQGRELGRPSQLYVRLTPAAGDVTIEVGGSAVIVARGQFTLPEDGDTSEVQ